MQEFTQLVTAIAALIAAIVSMVGLFRLKSLHVQLNSRMSELLLAAKAQGIVQERADQDARDRAKCSSGM